MQVYYDCGNCGAVNGPYMQSSGTETKPSSCPECNSKAVFVVNQERTIYRNFQKVTLQESPGSVPPGRLPRSKEVILVADLIDSVRPGDEVHVTGVYTNNFDSSLNTKNGFPVFATVIEANHVAKLSDHIALDSLTQDEVADIQKLSKRRNIFDMLVDSVAPSIHGHRDIKTALLLSMLSGVPKDLVVRPQQCCGEAG